MHLQISSLKNADQLLQLLREDETNVGSIRVQIEQLAKLQDGFYAELLKLLTHLEFDEASAENHWQKILAHQGEMSRILQREVGLRVALLDYFTTINKHIQNPKIIEISLFEQTLESAMTDALTGLYNRRYFEESLFREYQRAKRYNLVLSIMLIDIDHFKEYNDKYGHQTGDMVLAEVARILKSCCRDSDIACRYGGEEFAVIMAETIGPDGLHLARRMMNALHSYSSLEDQHNKWAQPVTVSCGIASFPIDAKYPKDLVQKADIALYQAKCDGRDRAYLYYEERRRYTRIDVRWVVKIQPLDTGLPQLTVTAKNVAPGGLLLEHESAFAVGSALQLELKLPKSSELIKGVAKVVRVEARNDGHFDMGLCFIDINFEHLSFLDKYISESAEDGYGRREHR